MQTTSTFFHPITPLGTPFSGNRLSSFRAKTSKRVFDGDQNGSRIMAFKKDGFNGKMVDENMIVLKERIRKMKTQEGMNYDDHQLADNWMEWERRWRYGGGYDSDVYQGIGLLQRFLMETRPSLALGLVAVLTASGATTAAVVLWWSINFFCHFNM